ncbi:MAG: hypothetical protein ACK5O2_08550 [Microthrixaceae bacterium]
MSLGEALPGPPPDPREDRFSALALALRIASWVVAAAAGVTLVADRFGAEALAKVLAVAIVVVLVGAPLVRVGWFARRWTKRGDRRYSRVALAVLVLPPLALLISVVTG